MSLSEPAFSLPAILDAGDQPVLVVGDVKHHVLVDVIGDLLWYFTVFSSAERESAYVIDDTDAPTGAHCFVVRRNGVVPVERTAKLQSSSFKVNGALSSPNIAACRLNKIPVSFAAEISIDWTTASIALGDEWVADFSITSFVRVWQPTGSFVRV